MSSNQEVVIHINGAAPPSALQQRFDALVMCNFTPRSPSELPRPQWVSFPQLFRLFKPHAPEEVWPLGPGNLKQLIVAWYERHPTFAGLEVDRWCTRFEPPPRHRPYLQVLLRAHSLHDRHLNQSIAL